MMQISGDIIISSIVSISITLFIGYIAFRLKLESRLKDIEKDLEILEPMKQILLKKGSDHVDEVFKERK